MESFSPKLPSFGSPKSHHHDSKPTRIQNSNTLCSTISPYHKCLVHPKPCNQFTPLNKSMYVVCDFNGRWWKDLSFLYCFDVLLNVEGSVVLMIKVGCFL